MRYLTMLLLVACGHPADGPAGPQGPPGAAGQPVAIDGSRLQEIYYVGTDGSRTPAGIFDRLRNERCQYACASDGKIRCMPVDMVASLRGGLWLDAGCTVPVGRTPGHYGIAPDVNQSPGHSSCGDVPDYGAIYGPLTSGQPVVYSLDSGTCTALTGTSPMVWSGPLIPASEFVAATVM